MTTSFPSREWVVTPDDLCYAAYKRCPCGAGLAYVPKWYDERYSPAWRVWDCSDILLGKAVNKNEEGAVTHTAQLPFIFYEIISERQPSVNGATTRPPQEK